MFDHNVLHTLSSHAYTTNTYILKLIDLTMMKTIEIWTIHTMYLYKYSHDYIAVLGFVRATNNIFSQFKWISKLYNALENCLAHGRGTAFKLYCKTKRKQNENTLLTFIIVLCLYLNIFLPVLTMSAKQYFDIYKSSAYYYYYYLHMYTKHKQNKKIQLQIKRKQTPI